MSRNEIPHDPRDQGVLSGVSKMRFEPVVHSAQTVHLSLCQDLHYLQTHQNKHLLERHHLGVPSSVRKMISKPMVRLGQTVQLSCVKVSTISKLIKTSIHLSLVT
jgi:hypothetical protein